MNIWTIDEVPRAFARADVLSAPEGVLTLALDRPADIPWTDAHYFCFDIRIEQEATAHVAVRFLDRAGQTLTVRYELMPGQDVRFRVRLSELWSRRHFLPVFPGSWKGGVSGLPMDPKSAVSMHIDVIPGRGFAGAVLGRVYVSDAPPAGIEAKKPLIDPMGQLIPQDWPTKTPSFAAMRERLRAEYERTQGERPPRYGHSPYGGYVRERFEATGWFRTQHDGRRWWLVDPEGCAFFSHGLCYGTRLGEFGWYTGLESFYQDAPDPEDPAFRPAFLHPRQIPEYVKRYGLNDRAEDLLINPARVNMIRVFGENWWEAWRTLSARRFHDWGINTMGVGLVNYEDERLEDFLRLSKLPYAVTLKRFPMTGQAIFRDFPDVFSGAYRQNSQAFARNELAPLAKDPYLIGYFLNNEPEWLFEANANLAWELLVNPAPLKSRAHLAAHLKERYGSVDALNAAWGLCLESFDSLKNPLPRAAVLTAQGQSDLRDYEQVLIRAYGEIPLQACRAVDPHHLCLGLRYAYLSERVIGSSALFDVFSFNCYQQTPAERLRLAERSGKPLIIGEWHFGAPECGLYRTALLSAATQAERGKAYRRYVEQAAACPNCVGVHYFEYNNQPVAGRFDGEHMGIGIIDCTNLPYAPMAEAMETASGRLYAVLKGTETPYDGPVTYLNPHW